MKFISKERYGQLVKISYPIVKANGFKMGAGNEQFTMAMVNGDMYTYILENHRNSFDILDIHLQGDCELDELCREKADWFKFMADLYDKPIDCTEAFYGDIATDRGYGTLKNQAYHAERIGCPNFCSVFYDLWESAFPASMQKFLKGWYKLCFKINGIFRNSTTEKYWGNWFEIINSKAPVPNIKPIIIEDSDMKLVNLKKGSINGQTWWLQEILMLEYGYPNNYDPPFDGKFGGATKEQVKEYQRANGLDDDGVVGIKTTLDLLFDVDKKPIEDRKESTDYWLKRLTVLTAFPDSYFNK